MRESKFRPAQKGAGLVKAIGAPVTGRSHQLRVHLKAIGHPILGDALYAPPEVASAAPRLLLHACGLRLAHPLTGTALEFSSPAPF
jgi:tRNA pseudouridine32 synthase/23S rRNA pseudouridine746 synthase